MVSLVLKSFWLIEAGPHRGRVHFITTTAECVIDFIQARKAEGTSQTPCPLFTVKEWPRPMAAVDGWQQRPEPPVGSRRCAWPGGVGSGLPRAWPAERRSSCSG